MTRKVVSEHHDNYSSLLGCNSITGNKIIGAFKDTGKEAAQLVNPEQKKNLPNCAHSGGTEKKLS